MNHKLLLLSLFGLSSNVAFSQQQPNFDTDKLKVKWQFTTAHYEHKPELLSVFTLTNTGTKALPSKGWTIYFNCAVPTAANGDTTMLKAELVNGDFIKINQGKAFRGLPSKASVDVKFLTRELKNKTDFPKGFYIVFDDQPEKGYKLALETASAINYSENEMAIAAKQFAQNQLVTPIAESKLNPIFPTPLSYTRSAGVFLLDSKVSIKADAAFGTESAYLSAELGKVFGVKPGFAAGQNSKEIVLQKKAMANAEAYELTIDANRIVISAVEPAGIFYGIQSLKLLLPADSWTAKPANIKLQGIALKDGPRFGYRAFMMDLARNFQQKEEVYKLIDMLSLYKINVLHLHLNDDEGWRIEIPGLPELTDLGSKRGHTSDEKNHLIPSYGSGPEVSNTSGSGFLSRNDYIALLKYATIRHIQVVPEFETPGHARAAIKSMNARYDRLMKAGQQKAAEKYLLRDLNDASVYRSVQGWNDNVVNPAMPSVYAFLAKITDEVIEMYKEAGAPLKTIHFGGDEVPAGVWEKSPAVAALLKSDSSIEGVDDMWHYYFNKVSQLLKAHGLYLSGWEETGLRKALVNGKKKMVIEPRFAGDNFHPEVWNNLSGNEDLAYKLANAGYQVVLTNVTNMYLDLAYNSSYSEPGQYWGGNVDVDKPFNFIPYDYYKNQIVDERGNPLPAGHFKGMERLSASGKANIIGLQAPLWSEIITSKERFEYLLLPKLFGLAERSWAADPQWATTVDSTQAKSLYGEAWSSFANVIGKKELPRMDSYAGGFAYRIPTVGLSISSDMVSANVQFPGLIIRYTMDGTEPDQHSPVYQQPLKNNGKLSFRVFTQSGRGGRTVKAE